MDDKCPECYNDPDWLFWRDQPINSSIELKVQRYPKLYYHTLQDALAAWGEQIDEVSIEN